MNREYLYIFLIDILQRINMPFKVPDAVKCPKCNQNVYAAEEVPVAGRKFHKMCFKCGTDITR